MRIIEELPAAIIRLKARHPSRLGYSGFRVDYVARYPNSTCRAASGAELAYVKSTGVVSVSQESVFVRHAEASSFVSMASPIDVNV